MSDHPYHSMGATQDRARTWSYLDRIAKALERLAPPPTPEEVSHRKAEAQLVALEAKALQDGLTEAIETLSEYVGDDLVPFTFTTEDQDTIGAVIANLTDLRGET